MRPPDLERKALKYAGIFINEDAYPGVFNACLDGEQNAAVGNAFVSAGYRSRLEDFPRNVDDFFEAIACLFSSNLRDHYRNIFERFDRLCGEKLADHFIGEFTIAQWAGRILDGLLRSLRDLTPSATGGAPAFRGISYPLDHQGPAIVKNGIGSVPARFNRQAGASQLFPNGPYRGIYTDFSALRAFLWGVFQGEVAQDIPTAAYASVLEHDFMLRGETFRGILLFQFHTNQPRPPGLTSFTIPEGKESSWRTLCSTWPRQKPDFWRRAKGSTQRAGAVVFVALPRLATLAESFHVGGCRGPSEQESRGVYAISSTQAGAVGELPSAKAGKQRGSGGTLRRKVKDMFRK
ncbi:hypothetical protein GMORB2_4570 [Geosmithia morbida]|uniref:Uncharacterized protein n=1 Tax=Geosmithia morbida TaxID=1094350 RepID=A0A9P4YMF8_9HYPO|nr:uncharacterized protein GMORB2_4570 [Geosmithia morbida]KAF4119661.1 hypothetical protein GMORB2_4570 [Geosmithia morbida]